MNVIKAMAGSGLVLFGTGLVALPAAAQTYGYASTIGADNGSTGLDNAHLDQPFGAVLDSGHFHLFVSDTANQRVQVFDSTTQAYVATIGPDTGATGADNGHFNVPGGVAVDPVHGHLFVADLKNNRVQIFNTANFAYAGTLGADNGVAGTDNAHFNTPVSVIVDQTNGQVLVTDIGNRRIQVFDSAKLTYLTSLGPAQTHAVTTIGPVGLAIDPPRNHIIITDYSGDCVELINTGSFTAAGTIGSCSGVPSLLNGQFYEPFGAGVDTLTGRILVADTGNNRVQIFDAASLAYLDTIGSDLGGTGVANNLLWQPDSVGFDPATGHILITDSLNNRVQVFAPNAAESPTLYSAVLPGSRSVQVGTAATVFAALINGGGVTENGCGVALPASAPSGLSMTYYTTNAQNQIAGQANQPASIASQNAQAYLLTFQSAQPMVISALPLVFDCTGATPAAVIPGLNTVDLSFGTAATADVIALAATPTSDGIVILPLNGGGAFAVATENAGAAQSLTVSVDFGGASIAADAGICETNPATGACLAPPVTSFPRSFTAGETPTFSIFVGSAGAVPFLPATNRVFVRFKDSAGGIHGSTSVAVTTQ